MWWSNFYWGTSGSACQHIANPNLVNTLPIRTEPRLHLQVGWEIIIYHGYLDVPSISRNMSSSLFTNDDDKWKSLFTLANVIRCIVSHQHQNFTHASEKRIFYFLAKPSKKKRGKDKKKAAGMFKPLYLWGLSRFICNRFWWRESNGGLRR
jgi:hypothetical protein